MGMGMPQSCSAHASSRSHLTGTIPARVRIAPPPFFFSVSHFVLPPAAPQQGSPWSSWTKPVVLSSPPARFSSTPHPGSRTSHGVSPETFLPTVSLVSVGSVTPNCLETPISLSKENERWGLSVTYQWLELCFHS
ncbi:hypothetical protein JMJ77_0002997 [Colletotrichum scovillei]|uniref:Uncharacterized protein n=1 Tax=Colletotrichum scovillei TaxID=1209932 RepID=A0A9P7QWF9_9PEZI|nr:hypothetical protein JMJ78_0006209 [Colletotrichum scovillei]KAG7043291.1 hypothetical protein JMJ77_0002997 [Colletotrichum scovillei]KAG7062738.1 hypothetical protein JMJ76_0009581 [Colletotrichum scovillei]